jgi:hypothetical protein
MSKNIFGATAHKRLAVRANLSRDRSLNLFTSIESLEKAIPVGPRFERLRDQIEAFYTTMGIVFSIEDRIDDCITKLEQEVGK